MVVKILLKVLRKLIYTQRKRTKVKILVCPQREESTYSFLLDGAQGNWNFDFVVIKVVPWLLHVTYVGQICRSKLLGVFVKTDHVTACYLHKR